MSAEKKDDDDGEPLPPVSVRAAAAMRAGASHVSFRRQSDTSNLP